MSFINYSQSRRPVFEVDLDLAPYDRWQEVGRQERVRLGRFLADIKKVAAKYAEEWLQRFSTSQRHLIRGLISGGIKVTGPLAMFVARVFGEDYQEEIRGLAHASGHDLHTLFLANLMYDISVSLMMIPTACSSFSTTLEESPVLVRNMAGPYPPSVGRYTFITRFWKGSKSYMNIAPLGCVGVLSAMRSGAWAVTLNQAPPSGMPRIFQWPAMHRLRAACDASLSYTSLVRRIREHQTMTSFFAHAVGTKPHEQAVIEHVAETSLIRKVGPNGHLIQTNHFISKKHKHLNPPNDGSGEAQTDYQCWRFNELEKRLKTQPTTFRRAFGKILPVICNDTMNSMILRPADGGVILKVRA